MKFIQLVEENYLFFVFDGLEVLENYEHKSAEVLVAPGVMRMLELVHFWEVERQAVSLKELREQETI